MAEAPPNGLYEQFVQVEVDHDRLEVFGEPFGPAGVAAVELSDGSVWQVDHVDPSRLVALDVDADDPAGSLLLLAAFGGDGAMRIADRARQVDPSDDVLRRESDEPWGRGHPPRSQPRSLQGSEAMAAGRLVLLADLAQDPSLDPLARIIAVVELVGTTRTTPGGDLFEPILADLVRRAEALAVDADPDDLHLIDPDGKRLYLAINTFTQRFGDIAPAVVELLTSGPSDQAGVNFSPSRSAPRLRALAEEFPDGSVAERAQAAAMAIPAAPPADATDFVGVERVSDAVIEVTAARSDGERWVRVLRRDGLVLLAQAPLVRAGLMDRAEVLVPPDTLDHEIEVQIIDVEDLVELNRRPADLIRDAVRAGRAAASAERRGDLRLAMRRWETCGSLWSHVGDDQRAELAWQRTGTAGGNFRGRALLVDGLDPYRTTSD